MKSEENKDSCLTVENLVFRHDNDSFAVHALNRRSLKYSDLRNLLKYVKSYLNQEGVGPEHRVAVVLANGPEMATAFLSIASMSVCAPLNPSYKEQEFEFFLSDLNVRAVVLLEGMESPVRKVAEKMKIPIIEISVDTDSPAGFFKFKSHTGFPPADGRPINSKDISLILHTSGTTARPKIVPLSQANLCASALHIRETLKLSHSDICLNVMPLFHIHGLIGAVLSSLSSGASVICNPGFEATHFFNSVKKYRPTWYTAVPTIHQAVLASLQGHKDAFKDHKFRFVRSSSASLPSQVMVDLEKALGAPVVEAYGMSEAAHQMTCNPLPPGKRKPKSVGIAAGPEVRVMDLDGTLLGEGQTGEIVIRGPNVITGYENNNAANEVAFAHGWFHTGDQGHMDNEGYLFLTGRIKEMINRAGEKISPLEVEEVLMTYPSVSQAVAFAIPHPTLGEDVGAAVILKKDMAVDEASLRNHLLAQLAEFKIPQCILIVEAIPKGPTGKLQRMKLAEFFKADLEQGSQDYAPPIGGVEKIIAKVWEENLKLHTVGRNDNFFRLGGDSLRLTKTLYDLIEIHNFNLLLKDLYEHQTVAELAKAIAENNVAKSPCVKLKRTSRLETVLASSIQERFYFLYKLNPKNSGSNGLVLSETKTTIDYERLRDSLELLVKRHEIFRTLYKQDNNHVVQLIQAPSEVKVELGFTDLSTVAGEKAKRMWKEAQEIRDKPFNLENEFPFRFHLYKLENNRFALLKVIHHVAEDATTSDIFFLELSKVYSQLSMGQKIKQMDPEFQYADYAMWEKENIIEDKIKAQLEYWKKKLAGASEVLHLPLDYDRKPVIGSHVETQSIQLPRDLWDNAKQLSQEEGTTVSILSMAIFMLFLHRYSGDSDLCVASPINLRSLKGFPNIMGPMINNFVIRSAYSSQEPFKDYLRAVLKSAQEAYINSDVSVEKMINLSGVSRNISFAPLYQTMFDVVPDERAQTAESGLQFTKIAGYAGAQDLDIYGRILEGEKEVHLQMTYNSDLFEGPTIQKFLKSFKILFEGIIADPNGKLSKFPLLGPDDGPFELKPRHEESKSAKIEKLPYSPPCDDVERALISVWESVLGTSPIGRNDDLFKLGGNSLYLIRMLNKMVDLGFNIELKDLYTFPTVAKLAEVARRTGSTVEKQSEIPLTTRGQSMPCSSAQQRMWFLSLMEKDKATYNMSFFFNIEGKLNIPAFQKAAGDISARHEILRTVFVEKDGSLLQRPLKDWRLDVSVTDLSDRPEEQAQLEKGKILESLQRTSFDLMDHPPLVARLICLKPMSHVFCLVINHIIFDGWSAGLFLTELQSLYKVYCQDGHSEASSSNRIQYIDYAVWHNKLLEGPVREQQTEFWKGQLATQDLLLNWPKSYPRPKIRTQNGNTILFTLAEKLQSSLKNFCEVESVTPFVVLLSAYEILLNCYTNQKQFVVGVPIANRNSPQLESIMGFFANTLALPAHINPNASFNEMVKANLALYLEVNKNQDLPFESIVASLNPKRSLSHTPIFQVLFNFVSRFVRRELDLAELKVTPLKDDRPRKKSSKFDLNLLFVEGPTGAIRGELEYSTDLFDEASMELLTMQYKELLSLLLDHKGKIGDFQYTLDTKKGKKAA